MGSLTPQRARELGRLGGKKNKGKLRPHTKTQRMTHEILFNRIKAEFKVIYQAWKDAALGEYILIDMGHGKIRVYKRSPNPRAISDMMDRALGKPGYAQPEPKRGITLAELEDRDL